MPRCGETWAQDLRELDHALSKAGFFLGTGSPPACRVLVLVSKLRARKSCNVSVYRLSCFLLGPQPQCRRPESRKRIHQVVFMPKDRAVSAQTPKLKPQDPKPSNKRLGIQRRCFRPVLGADPRIQCLFCAAPNPKVNALPSLNS